jgi:site-specific recombinase XerD
VIIKQQRHKSKISSRIPLLTKAKSIIENYESYANTTGYLLPIKSNQKMNEYLKEIAVLCDINKTLTTHVARHTFATTVALSNNVSMESYSKMMGIPT